MIAVGDMSSYVETKCGEVAVSVKITVPATSANLGDWLRLSGYGGFLYSEFTFERADELQISGCPGEVSQ